MKNFKRIFAGFLLSLTFAGVAFAVGETISSISSVDSADIASIDGAAVADIDNFNGFVFASGASIDLEATSTQYLSVADQPELSITGDMTIEAWIWPEAIAAGNHGIVGKYLTAGNQRSFIFDYSSTSFRFITSVDGTATTIKTQGHTMSTAGWTHVAMLYDASAGTAEVVVNGSSIGTMTGLDTSIFDGTGDLVIGAIQGGSLLHDGLMDDVRIWNVLKTPTDINNNKDAELVGNEAGLVGYWKLNNALTDSTANANTLTNNGGAVFSTTLPF